MTSEILRAAGLAFFVVLAGAFVAPAATAQQPVAVRDVWVRAPAPGQNVAAAYMELTSGTHALLIAVASPVAARAELHATTMDGGVMRMRQVESIELPPSKTVKLAPGGLHVMLLDLKSSLKPGDKLPLTLTVQRDGSRSVSTVQATVRSASGATPHQHH
jgi:copper(I)-binding protein